MTTPLPSRMAMSTWRSAAPALVLALSLALASASAWGAAATGNAEAARARLDELARMAEKSNPTARAMLVKEAASLPATLPTALRIDYLRLLRRTHGDSGSLPDAYAVDEQIIRLARAGNDPAQLALASLGRVHKLLNDNDPAAAMALLEGLNTQYRELGNQEFNASAELAYGAIYNILGQHDRALSHYLHGLELVQRHPGLWTPRESDLRMALARLYVNTGDAHKALATTRAFRVARGAMPPREEASMHYMDGRAWVSLGQLRQAHVAFGRALVLARRHELRWLQASILGNVSDAWLKEHRYVEAERAARAAIPVAESVAEQSVIQMAYANLGFALFGQGRMAEGSMFIDRTTADMRKAGAMLSVANLLAEKSAALEKAGLYKEALQTVREREGVLETLSIESRDKTFAALQEQFNAKQRAAQIAGLRQENAVKDAEIRNRTLRQAVTSLGAALALVLSAFVYMLYRKSQRSGRRLAELNAELAHSSAHDPLTGLYNRRSFVDLMRERGQGAQAVTPAAGASAGLAAAAGDCFTLLDIDHFKHINDQYGHAAGDQVLVEVGRRLNEAVRDADMVLRWGGEEFLVYSQGVVAAQRGLLVQRILNAIAGAPMVLDDGTSLQVSATAGAVSLPQGAHPDFGWEQAIALADRALYKGKEAGRNRGFIVDSVTPAQAAGDHRDLRLVLVLPDMHWQPAHQA